MLGQLTNGQIEQILLRKVVGHIGCCVEKKVYVVPVAFVYDNGYIYAHSREGEKVRMMRKNPNVCVQVDDIDNLANWRSVLIWGTYEELKGTQNQKAGMQILMNKLGPLVTSESVLPSHGLTSPPHTIEKAKKAIVYRIRVEEKTGRYEKTNQFNHKGNGT